MARASTAAPGKDPVAALADDITAARNEIGGQLAELEERLSSLTGRWNLTITRDDGSTIGQWTVPLDTDFSWEGEGLVVTLQP